MQLTVNIDNPQVYDSLVQFLKSLGIAVAEDEKEKPATKKKLSSLKGKVSQMTSEEIDKQIQALRDEWDRGF